MKQLVSAQSKSSVPTERPTTYAQITQNMHKNVSESGKRTKHVITVVSKNPNTTSQELKAQIKLKVNPSSLNIGISTVKNSSRGGVLMECHSSEEINKLCEAINKGLKGNTEAKNPIKKQPRIIIYNVSSEVTDTDLIDSIKKQNTTIGDYIAQNQNQNITFKFFTKAKSQHIKHAVLEVSPQLRKIILSESKLNVIWNRCNVADFTVVTRCFKCWASGMFRNTVTPRIRNVHSVQIITLTNNATLTTHTNFALTA
jgi:hypothetical protein